MLGKEFTPWSVLLLHRSSGTAASDIIVIAYILMMGFVRLVVYSHFRCHIYPMGWLERLPYTVAT